MDGMCFLSKNNYSTCWIRDFFGHWSEWRDEYDDGGRVPDFNVDLFWAPFFLVGAKKDQEKNIQSCCRIWHGICVAAKRKLWTILIVNI